MEEKEWERRREGSAVWRSCENGRIGKAGWGEGPLSPTLSVHTRSHRAAGCPLDKPEVQRAAHAGGGALHASCVHHPRDVCGLQGSQGL